ncbi:biotin/lipoyl-binding carrier protein [Aeromicrobium choanae]|uniref:Acetyl-CoA carboxylase biotin carboxyl carrier protein n=1 Tax=Aeromicrobium choanae TaxID=1736691 RepID=A0A1T4Z4X5_9ACTN|nr:biotin/lipoyl-binding carrier protein [Aeromicrobium choanae]SKB08923.1 acetyl-CoA carboxylase biotin carboxyl carrier protein [Aeromicrobium choanae]
MPETIHADLAANVWKILVQAGDTVEEDATIAILESMKMEIPVLTESSGTIVAVHVAEGEMVSPGQAIADIETS